MALLIDLVLSSHQTYLYHDLLTTASPAYTHFCYQPRVPLYCHHNITLMEGLPALAPVRCAGGGQKALLVPALAA